MTLPTGTLTFLFTDVEGSTRLWEEHPEEMRQALVRHDTLATTVIEEHCGVVVKSKGEGDSLFTVFGRASDGVAAALALQHAFILERWPLPSPLAVRMALHTGEAELRDGDYFGAAVNRCARLRSIGYGGQVLLSAATEEVARDHLPPMATTRDLGLHRLRDLARPEQVYQLLHPSLPAEFPSLLSLDALPTNLPSQMTSFIGREQEISEIKGLLPRTRALTLTGPGGCGKTRLALVVAADSLDGYRDGVWLVELASLSDPALVSQAVASALSVREQPGRPLYATIADHLKDRKVLLVLDNCEHLLAECARLTEGLLRSCQNLQVFATSREGLGIPGETTYRVPPLSFPGCQQVSTAAALDRYEAVMLFRERAAAAAPAFALTAQNAGAVAQICRRLDGIPLALELAAARVRALSVEEIAARLDDRFHLLTGGSRTALPRQQTLRALIDWSYDLLAGAERALLRRLSIFVGGWTLEAAEAVCEGGGIDRWEVLDLLAQLIDKSLVLFAERERPGRYRLLETVREYAREQLQQSGEEEALRIRHRDYCIQLAEAAHQHLRGPDQADWMNQLETEHDNLRAALAYSRSSEGSSEAALRLCCALSLFWYVHGHLSEGRRWLEDVLAASTQIETPVRAMALYGAGTLARDQADYRRARDLFTACRDLGRRKGYKLSLDNALHGLGLIAYDQGDLEGAASLFTEALQLARELEDKPNTALLLACLAMTSRDLGDYGTAEALCQESLALYREDAHKWGIATNLATLGYMRYLQKEFDRADALIEESLALQRELGNRHGEGIAWLHLGTVALGRGHHERAQASFSNSLSLFRDLGDKWGIGFSLEGMAELSQVHGDNRKAAQLFAAAELLRSLIGTPFTADEQSRHDGLVESVREALGDVGFGLAWAEGGGMSEDQAIECALQEA